MKKIIYLIMMLGSLLLLGACGEGTVDVGSNNYQPKIVVEGYLSPGSKVEDIKISRNFPLNSPISLTDVYLSNAEVKITMIETNKEYKLDFDPVKQSYKYSGNDLIIDYNKSYRLSVTATIDGRQLAAKSATTTPCKGFTIHKDKSLLGEMEYREKDQEGKIKYFTLVFDPSPGTEFYAIGTVATEASLDKFIFTNPYSKVDTNDVIKDLEYYKYENSWIQNVKSDIPMQSKNIEWMNTWFYGTYRTIMYAGDQNFKDYFITINQIQEMDGNYHEPKLHFDGDGIGIFGSFIADTVYFSIKK